MQSDASQVPVIKEVQPEVKKVAQAPQKPSVVPQTPPESAPPTKSKKKLKLKIFIVSLVLIVLGVGGFFIWKNIFVPKIEKESPVTEEGIEEEKVPAVEEGGIEQMSEPALWELCERESWPPHCSFISHSETRKLCEKCKELGIEGKKVETIEPPGLTQLTFLDNAADPDWSPDGSQIAFHDFAKNRIGITNADGTGLRYLDIGGDPNWSPVENKLAVMAWKEEQNLLDLGIYLVDLDTEETTFLVMGNQVCWSPDGTKIAYSLDEGGRGI